MRDRRSDKVRLGPVAIARYAALSIGGLDLLIPQSQVQAIEPADDVQWPAEDKVAWLVVGGARRAVFCLTEDLRPVHEIPAARRICVLLGTDVGRFGILCDEVAMFEQAEPKILPLPECMHRAQMPLRGLVLHGERVLCIASTDDLLACLDQEQVLADETSSPYQLLKGGVL